MHRRVGAVWVDDVVQLVTDLRGWKRKSRKNEAAGTCGLR